MFDLAPSAAVPCDGRATKATEVQVLCGPGQSGEGRGKEGKGGEGRVAEKPLRFPRPSLATCPGPKDFHRTQKWLRGTGEAVMHGQGVKRQVCMFWEQITQQLKIKK